MYNNSSSVANFPHCHSSQLLHTFIVDYRHTKFSTC